jgi:hypothetical protein
MLETTAPAFHDLSASWAILKAKSRVFKYTPASFLEFYVSGRFHKPAILGGLPGASATLSFPAPPSPPAAAVARRAAQLPRLG